jgi:hypothetical protein
VIVPERVAALSLGHLFSAQTVLAVGPGHVEADHRFFRFAPTKRPNGKATRTRTYPSANTKGPRTLWGAPGTQRTKIPFDGLNASRLEVWADLCEGIFGRHHPAAARQDSQLHYTHIEDTSYFSLFQLPLISMRREIFARQEEAATPLLHEPSPPRENR